jgi:ribonuclease P protein component
MLPKELRLKKKSDIDQIFKSGETSRSLHFVCKSLKNNFGFTRPCITISKKLKLNVPQKNRLKRQIIEALQSINSDNPAIDIVIILQKIPSLSLKRFETFQTELKTIINQSKNV